MSKDEKGEHSLPQSPKEAKAGLSRREMLRWSGMTGLSATAATVLPQKAAAAVLSAGNASAEAMGKSKMFGGDEPILLTPHATPIRPPAVPLAVRQPYLSS